MKKLFAGIDVSKLWLDVSIVESSSTTQHLHVDSDKPGFRKLLIWLRKFPRKQADWISCMEHTGIYTQPLWYFFSEKTSVTTLFPELQ